jgi:hypothetical protein
MEEMPQPDTGGQGGNTMKQYYRISPRGFANEDAIISAECIEEDMRLDIGLDFYGRNE